MELRILLLSSAIGASCFAQPFRYEAPGGGSVRLDASAPGRIKVSSDYWRLECGRYNDGAHAGRPRTLRRSRRPLNQVKNLCPILAGNY